MLIDKFRRIKISLVLYHRYVIKIEKNLKIKFYKKHTDFTKGKKSIIMMVDGRAIHGGLADRLKGATTFFALSKELGIDYRINFVYPFNLSDYLQPNEYDWIPKDGEIIYDSKISYPAVVNDYQIRSEHHKFYLRYLLLRYQQLHVYGNSPVRIDQFSKSFHILFKPSARLEEKIEENKSMIGSKYVSCTFRFQQLLGDFNEGNYPILSLVDQQVLINKCKDQIVTLHASFPFHKILVTADSRKFLESLSTISYVYIIPGRVVHMDYIDGEKYDTYEKSFLDFFLIADADVVHLVYGAGLFQSGFAKLAAMVNNKEYNEILISS